MLTKTLRVLGLLALLAMPAIAQNSTIANLTTDASPLGTDMFILQKVGDTRAKKTTRSALFGNVSVLTTSPLTGGGALSSSLTISLGTQSANTFLSGPTSGGAVAPAFRVLNVNDFPAAIITYAKIQNVSASPRLLGRSTAGAGSIEELTVGSGLSLSGGSLTATGTGTVTSVAASFPASIFTVAGSPVTTSGTLAASFATGQTADRVIGTCGGATTISLCALAAADIPTISAATQLSGTLAAGQFPALTGAVTTSAGSLATSFQTSPSFTTPTFSGHIKAAGSSPTCSSSGTGSTGACSVVGSDSFGVLTLTPGGTGIAATGTITLTFAATFTNAAMCTLQLVNGTGAWQANWSLILVTTESATAPQWTWQNNNGGAPVNLTSASTYKVAWVCVQR